MIHERNTKLLELMAHTIIPVEAQADGSGGILGIFKIHPYN
jgi:hypothetical protein